MNIVVSLVRLFQLSRGHLSCHSPAMLASSCISEIFIAAMHGSSENEILRLEGTTMGDLSIFLALSNHQSQALGNTTTISLFLSLSREALQPLRQFTRPRHLTGVKSWDRSSIYPQKEWLTLLLSECVLHNVAQLTQCGLTKVHHESRQGLLQLRLGFI
jgi:hypothetical protein